MTAVETVRLLCGDPAGAQQVLSDAEIQHFLDAGGGSYAAAAACAEAIAARHAARVDVRVGILSTSDGQLASHFRDLAEGLRKAARDEQAAAVVPWAGGVYVADALSSPLLVRPAFTRERVPVWADEERC